LVLHNAVDNIAECVLTISARFGMVRSVYATPMESNEMTYTIMARRPGKEWQKLGTDDQYGHAVAVVLRYARENPTTKFAVVDQYGNVLYRPTEA
jgi:hypothetical protein